jgi:hypothetical protein
MRGQFGTARPFRSSNLIEMCSAIEYLKLLLALLMLASVVLCGVSASRFSSRLKAHHRGVWRWLGSLKPKTDVNEVPQEHAFPRYLLSGRYKSLSDAKLDLFAFRARLFFCTYLSALVLLLVVDGLRPTTNVFLHCLAWVH